MPNKTQSAEIIKIESCDKMTQFDPTPCHPGSGPTKVSTSQQTVNSLAERLSDAELDFQQFLPITTDDQRKLEDKYVVSYNGVPDEVGEVLEKNAAGLVNLVADSYCLVDYDILRTGKVSREGLTTRPGMIFFYQMDFVGDHRQLQIGDEVTFDVVLNRKSGFYVAKNVTKTCTC